MNDRDFFFDKSVAIVGGADEWESEDADRCDIVAQVNSHWLRHLGRCDLLYTRQWLPCACVPSPRVYLDVHGPAPDRLWLLRKLRFLDFNIYNKPGPHGPDLAWCNVFCRELNTMPLTGIMAIRHLTLQPIRSLYITGFTFYAENGKIPERRDSHDLRPQVEWLQNLLRTDLRVSVDETLKKLLEC